MPTMKTQEIMSEFANRTGLTNSLHPPKRYLWTDSFAVCNFLELFLQTGEKRYKEEAFALEDVLHYPAEYRLTFRELGLSIGLQTVEKMMMMIKEHPVDFPQQQSLISQLTEFSPHLPLQKNIENFWQTTTNQKGKTWTEHIDINSVLLATSMEPDGYLILH